MNKYLSMVGRIVFVGMVLAGMLFSPQYSVFAAPVLTITPITWNVIGLDSNNVFVGPNNYPVGARVCNTGDLPAANVIADFVWDDGLNDYTGNAYINLRSGSYSELTFASLAANTCVDAYFEVTITRNANAYDRTRAYRITVDSDQTALISTPTPREIYVEHLVSQNRNSVLDIQLEGVSIAAGGTMNLLLGNTYTIKLISETATNGYEQIETFINFPNTIFQILSVSTTYTAFPTPHTDPDWYRKLYADGCGWDNITRTCTGTGKYGGTVTVTYEVKIISGGGTSQPLNTLIYDFSGSSYHYNNDFALSTRIANIIDPAACLQQTITSWQYSVTNDTSTPTTGTGAFTSSGLTGLSTPNDGNPARSLSSTGWPATKSTSDYLEYAVSTAGFYSIHFNFDIRFDNGGGGSLTGPNALDVGYSTATTPSFTDFATNQAVTNSWASKTNNLDSVTALSNNANARFRIFAYNADANDQLRIDNVTVTGCALPAAINLSKNGVVNPATTAPANVVNVGDHIDYTLVITNTGGVPLTNITLADNKIDPASLVCTPPLAGLTLFPGQSTTCTGFYTLTQADFDNGSVTNTATASSAQVGPVSDSTTQTLPQSPALTLEKSASLQTFTTIGQQVTYTYTLTNSGNVTLTSPYSVIDNKATVDCSSASSPLLPGQSTTCTATYTITADDIAAGLVTNLATANATFGNSSVTSNQDSVTINYAGLNIVKEVSIDGVTWNDTSVTVNVGSTVYYRIRVQNTGNVILTGFTVDDGMPGCTLTRAADAPGNDDANFEPKETWVYTCSVTAVVGTQNNTATADSNETDPDSDTASYFGANPSLSILKSEISTGPYIVGNTISYNIVVTNTGNVTLTNVEVADNSAVIGICNPAQPATLAPTETMTCTATHIVAQADVDNGSYVNTATADSDQTPPSSGTVTVNFVRNPGINIVKSSDASGTNALGDTITYTYNVTNTGNVTLTNVTVTDAHVGLSAITCLPAQGSSLAPGGTITCTATYVITLADVNAGQIDNTGVVTGTPPNGPNVTDNDPLTVSIAQNPQLAIVKSEISNGPYSVNETITYSIVVTNTGDVTLTNVTVVDNSAAIGTCNPAQPATLTPTSTMICSASYLVTQVDINSGSYVNTAIADSNETVPADSTVTVNLAQNPGINIVKNSNATGINAAGDTITYTYDVTNIGNVTLTNVTVTDAHVGLSAITCSPAQGSSLAPSGTMACSATYVVTLADINAGVINNTGVVTGTPPVGQDVTDNDPLSEPVAQNPGISIVKSSNATGTNVVGDTITYSYLVTNTGNVTLTNVTVTDVHVGLSAITCLPAQGSSLVPSGTMTCTATYVVTLADVNAGEINNTGVVTGTPPGGPDVTAEDLLSEPVAQNPQLEILKSITSNGPYILGDTITYNIVVTNTGNITLTGVTVTDNSAILGVCNPVQPATLTPGAVMTCPASHVVTEADLVNRSYANTATANSSETDPASSTATVNFDVADLSLTKEVTNTTPIVSTNINFIVTVTNNGPDNASGVEVSDILPSGFTYISDNSNSAYNSSTGRWLIGDLEANHSISLSMTVRVNATGSYTNTAEIVNALVIDPDSTPNNQNPNEDDQSSVTVAPRPEEENPNPPKPKPTPVPVPVPAIGGEGFLIPVTGFAPDVVTNVSLAPFVTYSDTSIMLEIPSLSVNIPIVGVPKKDGGWNVSWLTNQAGWLEGSAFPSWNGNSVLTSHIYLSNGKPGPFAKLHELKTGDQVIVHAFGQKYVFEVQTSAIVSPTDRSVMKHEERPWLTLVTCTDYDAKTGTYKNRFIVRAVLVKVSADK